MGTDFSLSPLRHAPHVETRKIPVSATELEEAAWWDGNRTKKTNSPDSKPGAYHSSRIPDRKLRAPLESKLDTPPTPEITPTSVPAVMFVTGLSQFG